MRTLKMLALGLAMLAFSGAALRADTLVLQDINHANLIPWSTGDVYGGSLTGATLNGVALPWVYCVQIIVDVPVPGTYENTIVDNTGVIHNSNPNPTAVQAEHIAWLLSNYANAAITDKNQQIALQAAIWNVEGFGSLNTSEASATVQGFYNTMTANVGSGDVSQYLWMTPGTNGNNQYQGLVTAPDGGMTLMLLGGALVGLATLRRRFRV